MRPNIITEAGISTRLNQWWSSTPFITSGVTIICAAIYLVCLLIGYDSYSEICFLPSAAASHFQVYRFYTSVLFHGSLLHVLFNMLTFVPLGTELERIMGSVRLLFLMFLLATTNAIFHLIVAFLGAYNPIYPVSYLVNECSIGFSGVIFSMIVIETSLSGVQYRSIFGLFNVPAKWYAWVLLVLFQFLASNVSLLGHLSGILSGFAYTYGLFNYLLPGPSFYSSIEGWSVLSVCVRRPGFILCTGGTTYGQLPTHSNTSIAPSSLINGNFLRNISSWMPSRQSSTIQTSSTQEQEDPRFPGRGRTLASTGTEPTAREANANLHARLLDNTTPSDPLTNSQHAALNTVRADATITADQTDTFDEELKKLVGIGFEKTGAPQQRLQEGNDALGAAAAETTGVKGFHPESSRGESSHNNAPKRVATLAGVAVAGAEALGFRPEKLSSPMVPNADPHHASSRASKRDLGAVTTRSPRSPHLATRVDQREGPPPLQRRPAAETPV